MVESKFLKIESGKHFNLKGIHFVYSSTPKLERTFINMTNQLLSIMKLDVDLLELKELNSDLLHDVLSRCNLYESQKSAKILA